jgi:hypothetical protein
MSKNPQGFVLDESRVKFIQGRVCLTVASRDEQLRPSVCVAIGCRVNGSRDEVTVLVPRMDAGSLLDHVHRTGEIALVAADPVSHEAVQVKGSDARVAEVLPGDAPMVGRHLESLSELLLQLGTPPAFVHQVAEISRSECVAICFTPMAMFLQTPGPHAGESLEAVA